MWWEQEGMQMEQCSQFAHSKKHLKLLKRDEILRGKKAQHSGKSASESNIITAVHQIYICMLELIGTRFLMEKRLFYPSRD